MAWHGLKVEKKLKREQSPYRLVAINMTVWLYTPLLYQFSLFYAAAHILNRTWVLTRILSHQSLKILDFYGKIQVKMTYYI